MRGKEDVEQPNADTVVVPSRNRVTTHRIVSFINLFSYSYTVEGEHKLVPDAGVGD